MAARTPAGREDVPVPDGEVVVGRIGRAHGVHGELRAFPTGPTLGGLPDGVSVRALGPALDRPLVVAGLREGVGALLVRFVGVDDRDAASALAGALLTVPQEALPRLADDDEFYVRDLIGCDVTLAPGGGVLGRVTEVFEGAANDSLEVHGEAGVHLVPFTRDAIVTLDVPGRAITVRADLFGGGEA